MILLPKQKYDSMMSKTKVERSSNDDDIVQQISIDEETTHGSPKESLQNKTGNLIEVVLPLKYQEKAQKLLRYLKDLLNSSFTWNNQGEILLHNKVIPHTHVIDLIRDVIVPNIKGGPPLGYQEFYSFLKSIHIPKGMISKNKRGENIKKYDEQIGGGSATNGEKLKLSSSKKKYYIKRNLNDLLSAKEKRKWLHFKL